MVRSWIRQALRASGVAILVPAAIAAAIALSVLGGNGGVGSLSEILEGPAAPPAEAVAAAAAPRTAQPRRDERPRFVLPSTRGRGSTSPVIRLSPAPNVTTVPLRPRHPEPAQQPAPAAPAPAAPAPPSAPTPSSSHPVHDAGTQVAETVRPLPVAGPVAAGAVQAVVDLVDPPA